MFLNKITEIAKELNKSFMWLAVWEENKSAISFYEKNQFSQTDTMEVVLGYDVQTGLIMKKTL